MIIKKYFLIFLLLLISTIVCDASDHKIDYIINQKEELLKLDKGVEVYIDQTNTLSLADILHKNFEINDDQNPNFGITSGTVWIKFRILNQTTEKNLYLLVAQPSIDNIALHTLNVSGKWQSLELGEYKAYKNRFIDNPNYTFPVSIESNTYKEFYISIKSKDQLQTPIYIGTERMVSQWEANRALLFGIYIGVILIMVAYHFFIYFSVKTISYLFYILFIIGVGLVQLNFQGYAFKFLWPNSPWMALNSTFLVPMLSGLTTAFFVKKFLHTKQFTPKLHTGINIYISLCVLSASIGMFGYEVFGVMSLQIIALIGAIYGMYIAYVIIQKNYRPAKFFLLAFALFFICIIIFVLTNFNIVPFNLFTSYILEIGSILQIVFLSFALADEININRKEKEASQAQALNILKENERIIKEQNIILEKEVSKRTADLSESNENLQKLIYDLKQAQTQLVEAEKLASLGMLTAGIAHEINNPINFVTSSINPLKRDINEIFEALTKLEDISLSSTTIAEKKLEIGALKNRLEIDFLKEEVQFLLTGIEEGAQRTAGIVKSLRIFSRVDEYDLKQADINLGMKSTLMILNSVLSDIELKTNYGELPLIECYPGKLNQLFLNLITNASYAIKKKYNGQSGSKLDITTLLNEDYIYIHIKDNGTGIDENIKDKIFDPFFTTKDVGEGTGLGLSIAYQTILKHQGEIILNSKLGEGTEFIIKIPIKQSNI